MKPWALAVPVLLLFLSACRLDDMLPVRDVFTDDLTLAKQAQLARDWPRAERVLERMLRTETDPEKRWEAWHLLLQAVNAAYQEPRASLEFLDAMLMEYEDDPAKEAEILAKIGEYSQSLRQYERGANAWSAYASLPNLSVAEQVRGYRNLAAAEYGRRRFDAAEEALQQCLSLPVPDHDKIWCMVDLADAGMGRQQWQDVDDICQQIQDSDPDAEVLAWASYYRGDALEQLGKPGEALKQFEQALPIYPNPAVIENRIAYLKKQVKAKK